MPIAKTTGEHVLEAVVGGPDQANRLFTVTGTADVNIFVSGTSLTETWAFLVGPVFTSAQFYRAIGMAAVSSQTHSPHTGPVGQFQPSFQVQINSVEADWDQNWGRVKVGVEIFVTASASAVVRISGLRYWVAILARV